MAGAASGGRKASVLVGLVGSGIGLSRTPAMHEAAWRALDLPYIYRLLDADAMPGRPALADIVNWAERFGFNGINVTYPFKQAIHNQQTQIGLWVSMANPYSTEICAGAGFDWLLLDGEHAPNDLRSLMAQLHVVAGYPGAPPQAVGKGRRPRQGLVEAYLLSGLRQGQGKPSRLVVELPDPVRTGGSRIRHRGVRRCV